MRIFITGVSGLVGSAMARHLVAEGHIVAGSTRVPDGVSHLGLDRVERLALGEAVDPTVFRDQDLVVHAAYSPGSSEEQANVEGTLSLAHAAREAGVDRQVFLSSFSARPDATGGYGRMKFSLEEHFLGDGLEVLRPGLVLGPGGLFGNMVRLVRSLPVIPLPDGARNRVPIIGMPELLGCFDQLLREPRSKPVSLCCPMQPTLRQLLESIARTEGRARLFVPFPTAILVGPVELLAKLGIRLGVDADSLRGYRTNTETAFESDFDSFFDTEPTLDAMVAAVLRGSG